MRLPGADNAVIDRAKLVDYCLSLTHPVGRHKARVFLSALGLTAADTDFLTEVLRQGIKDHEAQTDRLDQHGQRYSVDVPLTTGVGSAIIRAAWIIRTDEGFPRLVTCYVVVE